MVGRAAAGLARRTGRTGPRGRQGVGGARHAARRRPSEHQDDVRGRLQGDGLAPDPSAAGTGGLTMNKPIATPTPADSADIAPETTKMNMIQAINSAMDVMLGRDPNVLVFGEDVGYFG